MYIDVHILKQGWTQAILQHGLLDLARDTDMCAAQTMFTESMFGKHICPQLGDLLFLVASD